MAAALVMGILPAGRAVAAEPLQTILDEVRTEMKLPALAALRIDEFAVAETAVSGVRIAGGAVPVTVADLWHLGSITKGMTATLTARLIERGVLRFDMTLAEALPELAPAMHQEVAPITLEMLLCHRGGLPANPPFFRMLQGQQRGADTAELRARVVEEALKLAPEHMPGQREHYSNLGYIVLGRVLETATGQSWEDLVREEVFGPLGIASAGFGPPGVRDAADQPRGHRPGWQVDFAPVEPDGFADNPAFLGPAGTVHMALGDWALFLIDQMQGARGQGRLLSPDSYRRLHAPVAGTEDGYALGFLRIKGEPWAAGPVIAHDGSNTLWFALMAGDPASGRGLLIATNAGGDAAQRALFKVLRRAMEGR